LQSEKVATFNGFSEDTVLTTCVVNLAMETVLSVLLKVLFLLIFACQYAKWARKEEHSKKIECSVFEN
jgi:hypothetical protein